MAAEQDDDADQCTPPPLAQHSVEPVHVGSKSTLSTSHFAQSHAIVAAACHGANRPRPLLRCALHSLLLAAPLACSHMTSACNVVARAEDHVHFWKIDFFRPDEQPWRSFEKQICPSKCLQCKYVGERSELASGASSVTAKGKIWGEEKNWGIKKSPDVNELISQLDLHTGLE